MDISIYRNSLEFGSYEELLADIRAAEAEGLKRYWIPSAPVSADGLSLAAAAAMVTSTIDIAVGVVPIPPRHPMVLAQQALTVSGLSGGRLTLGVGMSVPGMVEGGWGLDAKRPRARLEAFLEILVPLLSGSRVSVDNEFYRVNGGLNLERAAPPSLYLAVMGRGMAASAGALADGAMTFLAGPEALRTIIIPAATAAAEAADRPAPSITAGVPVCVTSDVAAATERAEELFGGFARHPSGASLLGADGRKRPVEFAVIGGPEQVRQQLGAYAEAGADEIAVVCFGPTPEDVQQTRALIGESRLID